MTDSEIQLQETQAALYVPGSWRCPKCNFTQFKSILFTGNGSVAADLGQQTEGCPNDGEPMVRVTWKERCEDLAKVCEQQIARSVEAEEKLENRLRDTQRLNWIESHVIEIAEELHRLGWRALDDAQWENLELFLRRIRHAVDEERQRSEI